MINRAAELLNISIDYLREFSAIDTFNNNNALSGYLCYRPDHRYGALVILSINNEPCEQIIYATPKLHYPFDKNGVYHWPECRDIKYYEKLDGTNILAYHYDYQGNDYVTFKTRLTPVVKDIGYGMFESMLREYLANNEWIHQAIELNPLMNLSFELFGSRNPITVKYDTPLAVCLLFGVRCIDGAIKPPSELSLPIDAMIPFYAYSGSCNDNTQQYNDFRIQMSERNKFGQDESFVTEGMVMYANTGEPSWRMFKCKPEEIEKIHWAASGSIPRIALMTTAMNVFEDKENPSINDFILLLQEEYPQSMIDKAIIKISKAWETANVQIKVTRNINEIWLLAKQHGLDVTKDKAETMRFMSKYFEKNIMRKVGSIILRQAGLI